MKSRCRIPNRPLAALACLAEMDGRRLALWAAFVWYLAIMIGLGPAPWTAWMRAVGLGALVGSLLVANAVPPGGSWRSVPFWAATRFYLIPFCVSSFSAQTRGEGFRLIFPPSLEGNAWPLGAVGALLVIRLAARRVARRAGVRATA